MNLTEFNKDLSFSELLIFNVYFQVKRGHIEHLFRILHFLTRPIPRCWMTALQVPHLPDWSYDSAAAVQYNQSLKFIE